jgi:hypothetical protein
VRRPITAALTALACAVALSGCMLVAQPPVATPQPSEDPVGQAPEGWADLQRCDTSDPWVWVDGYPVEQMEAAGLEAECGGTYFDPDIPTYVSVGDASVSPDQLDALRAGLESAGYQQIDSTFRPPQPGGLPGLLGSFQYERAGDEASDLEAIFIVNFWRGTDPEVYETFVDYESPATRDLQR